MTKKYARCMNCVKWFVRRADGPGGRTLCLSCAAIAARVKAVPGRTPRGGAPVPDGQEERIAALAERAAKGLPLFGAGDGGRA